MIEVIPNWHPAFVHFPIAFTTAAVAFITIGTLFKNKSYAAQCQVTGRWILWAAALFALIAAVFGWLAYNRVAHDEISHAAMTVHRNWALGTLAALLVLAAWDVWRGRSGKMPSPDFVTLLAAAWLLVISTAWHGAELVYRHGLGVMSLPQTEGSSHSHEHGAGHSHEGTAIIEHSDDAKPDGAGTAHKNNGHSHAPGTPPHQD